MSSHSSYVLDSESLVEASRLVNQDRFITTVVSLLPPNISGNAIHQVLDIGCGPGGWLLDLAAEYPIRGVGIDISDVMVNMAQHFSVAELASYSFRGAHLDFRVADARNVLPFPDKSFDFVHARLCHTFLHQPTWLSLLQECHRLLEKGGILCVSDLEDIQSNQPNTDTLYRLWPQILHSLKHTFSPSGRSLGLVAALPALAKSVGFQERKVFLHALDASADSSYHTIAMENHRAIFNGIRSLIPQTTRYTAEEIEAVYSQALIEMGLPDFVAVGSLFTLTCKKV